MMSSRNYSHDDDCHNKKHEKCEETPQTHTHEFLGSVKLAEQGDDRHNHRFAGVTTQVQLIHLSGGGHKHAFMVNTDFLDHLHELGGETGPAIDVGHHKHVHFAAGMTTCNDGHFHDFQFATLIDSPLVPVKKS